jgi:hypothetical protein
MRRSIDQWRGCDPKAMATQSEAALTYAFEDARADILALHEALHGLLRSDVGIQTMQKLADGHGTNTADGKAWLRAAALIPPNGAHSGVPAAGENDGK